MFPTDSPANYLSQRRRTVFGRGFVSASSSGPEHNPLNATTPNRGMAGSLMILRFPSLAEAWERIKGDAYWTEGVWDKERVEVRELLSVEGDETAEWKQ